MKKIFTLLFCVAAMSLTASATDTTLIDRCINVLLGNESPTMIMATNLDANHDGVITIADVSTLVDQALEAQRANLAPAQYQDAEVEAIINELLVTDKDDPTINDVSKAIDCKINNKK